MANGIMNNDNMLCSILVDLNNAVKSIFDGQYVAFCSCISEIGQKVVAVRSGVKSDMENRNKTIEELKQQLRNAGESIKDMTPEEFVAEFTKKDGANDGSN